MRALVDDLDGDGNLTARHHVSPDGPPNGFAEVYPVGGGDAVALRDVRRAVDFLSTILKHIGGELFAVHFEVRRPGQMKGSVAAGAYSSGESAATGV